MSLTEREIRAALHCVSEAERRRRQDGIPIPEWMRQLFDRLEYEVRYPPLPVPDVFPDPIGSAEAATILGWTIRWTQKLAADLDGVRVGGRWLFSRKAVTEYAEARRQFVLTNRSDKAAD